MVCPPCKDHHILSYTLYKEVYSNQKKYARHLLHILVFTSAFIVYTLIFDLIVRDSEFFLVRIQTQTQTTLSYRSSKTSEEPPHSQHQYFKTKVGLGSDPMGQDLVSHTSPLWKGLKFLSVTM